MLLREFSCDFVRVSTLSSSESHLQEYHVIIGIAPKLSYCKSTLEKRLFQRLDHLACVIDCAVVRATLTYTRLLSSAPRRGLVSTRLFDVVWLSLVVFQYFSK